jgi:hypothetical protein
MKNKFTKNPVLIGLTTGLLLLICCSVFTIPMYDGVYHYEKALFLVEQDGKVALRYLMGFDLETVQLNNITPEIHLKPIGYVLFVLIHIGLPVLAGLRVHFANLKNASSN